MNRSIEQRTVRSFCRRQPKINVRPDYQRGPVWSRPQKQLLIDSILRDLDIPKIYLREIDDSPYEEEAVDGQQRLTAIWEFASNGYPLAKDCDDIEGEAIAGMKFDQLDEDLKNKFEAYELCVVCLRKASEHDVEEMFLPLQNGTSLNAAEKRNALPGNMKPFVRTLAQHSFFTLCGFQNGRFAFDHVAAQMTLLELSGGPCNIKTTDLARMYHEHQGFDDKGPQARKCVGSWTDSPRSSRNRVRSSRFNAVSLYLLVSQLMETFDVRDLAPGIGEWFIDFETQRRQDEAKPSDERDPSMVSYQKRTSHATDSQDSLEYRHQDLLPHLHEALPNLVPLDARRHFTEEQRLAIFRRDGKTCQLRLQGDGRPVTWDNWHADHRKPWSRGGARRRSRTERSRARNATARRGQRSWESKTDR